MMWPETNVLWQSCSRIAVSVAAVWSAREMTLSVERESSGAVANVTRASLKSGSLARECVDGAASVLG